MWNKKSTRRRKGQVFTIDSILALGVFLMIMVSMVYIWDYTHQKTVIIEKRDYMERLGRSALNTLILTPGEHADWYTGPNVNSSILKYLGLAKNNPLVLDEFKINSFESWNMSDYEEYKKILGLQGLDFRIRVYPYSGGYSGATYTIGSDPQEKKDIVKLQRAVLLDNAGNRTWAMVDMEVWET